MSYKYLFKINHNFYEIEAYDLDEAYKFLESIKIDSAVLCNEEVDEEDIIKVNVDNAFELLDDFYNNRNKKMSLIDLKDKKTLIFVSSPEDVLKKYNLLQFTKDKNDDLVMLLFKVKQITTIDEVFLCSKCKKWKHRFDNKLKETFITKNNLKICLTCSKKNNKVS